jgi:hypothetical protein
MMFNKDDVTDFFDEIKKNVSKEMNQEMSYYINMNGKPYH